MRPATWPASDARPVGLPAKLPMTEPLFPKQLPSGTGQGVKKPGTPLSACHNLTGIPPAHTLPTVHCCSCPSPSISNVFLRLQAISRGWKYREIIQYSKGFQASAGGGVGGKPL